MCDCHNIVIVIVDADAHGARDCDVTRFHRARLVPSTFTASGTDNDNTFFVFGVSGVRLHPGTKV